MIKVEDIHKSFGDEEILKGISTTFDKGKSNFLKYFKIIINFNLNIHCIPKKLIQRYGF